MVTSIPQTAIKEPNNMSFQSSLRGEDPSEWLLDEEVPQRDSLLDRCDRAKWCIKAHKNKFNRRNRRDFTYFCDKSVEDKSIGIHYSIDTDITGLGTLVEIQERLRENPMRNSEGEIIERKMGSLRQIHNFVNVLNEGDTVIIGQGNCDGRGGKRLLVATIASGAYFDDRDIWSDRSPSNDEERDTGVYTRRKIRDIVELPAGSRLDDLKVKIQTLTKQEGGFGVVLGGM